MDNLIHNIHKTYINTVAKITPTLTESEFEKKGVLTPEEVLAQYNYLRGNIFPFYFAILNLIANFPIYY